MNPKEILEHIKAQAMKKGVSMAQVCRLAGISYTTYWRWEKGEGMQTHKLMNLRKAVDSIPN